MAVLYLNSTPTVQKYLQIMETFSIVSLEGPAIRGKSWMREYTRRPEEKPFPVSCLAGSKLDRPARLSCCWRLQKNCSQPTKIAHRKKLLMKFAHNEQIYCEQTEQINFAHGESWIALQSICNLSMDAWHDFYLHTNCSNRRKFAHS